MPIRLRLTAWYVLVIGAVMVALTAFVVTRLRSDLTSELDGSLESAAREIRLAYSIEGRPEFFDTADTVLSGSRTAESAAQLLDAEGRVRAFQGGEIARTPLIAPDLVDEALGGETIVLSTDAGVPSRHLRVVAVDVRRQGRNEVVVVAESLGEIDQAASRVFLLLASGGAAALGVIAIGGWWIARKALSPVERMTRRADQIGLDDLSHRIVVPAAEDELGHLAHTLNAMLDRVEQGVQARQRLVADASHELRAPLAAMRTELEVSMRHDAIDDHARSVLDSAREEVVRMGRIVDNLLTLAAVDEGHLMLAFAPQDLADLARRAVRSHGGAATDAGVGLVVAGAPASAWGDRERLDQVMNNLLDNALRFAPPDSEVTVSTWADETTAGFAVADRGPGVPTEARQRIFERFGRGDPSRGRDGGAGLGLAICSEIVIAHRGTIRVEERAGGGGGVFVVTLPRAFDRDAEAPLVAGGASHTSGVAVEALLPVLRSTAALGRCRLTRPARRHR